MSSPEVLCCLHGVRSCSEGCSDFLRPHAAERGAVGAGSQLGGSGAEPLVACLLVEGSHEPFSDGVQAPASDGGLRVRCFYVPDSGALGAGWAGRGERSRFALRVEQGRQYLGHTLVEPSLV